MTPGAATDIEIHKDDFLTFTDVCKGLKGVMPRKNKSWLEETHFELIRTDKLQVDLQGTVVTMDELNELFHITSRTGYDTNVVSPVGAKLLLKLYQAGLLDLSVKKVQEPSAEFLAYCAGEGAVRERAKLRIEKADTERKAREAYEARLTNLDGFQVSEFTFRLLDDIFWRNIGKGEGTLVIAGVPVYKALSTFASNSGKSRDFRVTFSWTGADGQRQELQKDSAFQDNRRNDAERNWGLHE